MMNIYSILYFILFYFFNCSDAIKPPFYRQLNSPGTQTNASQDAKIKPEPPIRSPKVRMARLSGEKN